jgi:hypothetical protein
MDYGLKQKTKREVATSVPTAQHMCKQFFSSFFLFCSTTNMVLL